MRIRPIAWIAGQVVLAAVVVLNATLYTIAPSHSVYFASESVSLGWPLVFLSAPPGEPIGPIRWEALLLDVLVMLVLAGGTVVAVARWTAPTKRPGLEMVQILVVSMATLLLWRAMFLSLRFNWVLLLAWCALAIVFAAVGCACYAVVATWSWRLPRFSLRMLIAFVTFFCIVLALAVGTRVYIALAVLVLVPAAYVMARYLRGSSGEGE